MELSEDLLWLCRVPSPPGRERSICDELLQRLSALPLAAPVRRYGDSLVVPLTRGSGGPKVLLVAQLDAVEAGQSEARWEGARVLAAGAADSKSGLCLMLALARKPPAVLADVTLVFHARGELGMSGSELSLVVEHDGEVRGADIALVLKPTDNKLQLGCAGSTQATLGFRGRAAHSGLPGAQNAVHRFAGVLSKLASFEPVPDVVDGLTWYETFNVTSIQGGRGGSVVPAGLEVNLHHTFGPSSDSHDSQDKLIALVDRVGAVRFEELSEPARPHRAHPLIAQLESSGVRAVEARQTWTEVARFAALGIAAANFGPGPERAAHTREEYVELSEIEAARAIVWRWLSNLS